MENGIPDTAPLLGTRSHPWEGSMQAALAFTPRLAVDGLRPTMDARQNQRCSAADLAPTRSLWWFVAWLPMKSPQGAAGAPGRLSIRPRLEFSLEQT
jgi:hypothetical protein